MPKYDGKFENRPVSETAAHYKPKISNPLGQKEYVCIVQILEFLPVAKFNAQTQQLWKSSSYTISETTACRDKLNLDPVG